MSEIPNDQWLHDLSPDQRRAAVGLLALATAFPYSGALPRACRIVGGYSVPYRSENEEQALTLYAAQLDNLPLREIRRIGNALVERGLLATNTRRPAIYVTDGGTAALATLSTSEPDTDASDAPVECEGQMVLNDVSEPRLLG